MIQQPIYALSVRPPWAQFIIYGIPLLVSVDNGNGSTSVKSSGQVALKDIENRGWEIPKKVDGKPFILPQRIYIHASKKEDPIEGVLDMCVKKIGLPFFSVMHMTSPKFGRGAIIGEITLLGYVRNSKSPWAIPGQFHFMLKNPTPYKSPVPCKGKLGFFVPDIDLTTIRRGV